MWQCDYRLPLRTCDNTAYIQTLPSMHHCRPGRNGSSSACMCGSTTSNFMHVWQHYNQLHACFEALHPTSATLAKCCQVVGLRPEYLAKPLGICNAISHACRMSHISDTRRMSHISDTRAGLGRRHNNRRGVEHSAFAAAADVRRVLPETAPAAGLPKQMHPYVEQVIQYCTSCSKQHCSMSLD